MQQVELQLVSPGYDNMYLLLSTNTKRHSYIILSLTQYIPHFQPIYYR